ncbi:hypothetical protein tloyanaT_29350 [Thalassotalea loyana]|uniref:Uncharacterized protein n=1 Tax=Thalassotalea loyana TaxID=280483 RepID=A0ABQ6HEZ9_9GAMM|nr:hypothetical protein [Thalassotalea loyana]GLX86682.1 hypothetical protein tloyanaT_29350 [Thalassotalea loyana]
MLLLVVFVSILSACFFYVQAVCNGLGKKRWAFAGLVFGPLLLPMFNMQKRMKVYRQYGIPGLLFNA